MRISKWIFWSLLCGPSLLAAPNQILKPDDFALLRVVEQPNISPDGERVAYAVSATNLEKDKRVRNLWWSSWDGKENRQLTFGLKGQAHPRFSPDGKWIAFISSRSEE